MTRILIVDDNQPSRYMLQVLLTANDCEVEIATNGVEALEQARHALPDLIISDILMPVMDGFTLCRVWKSDEKLTNIPFVFYTATYTDPKDEDFALGLGADHFIVKPMEPDKLLALLRETIETYKGGRLVAPCEPLEEAEYYKQYNAVLIHKLEDKVMQLEEKNRALEIDIVERKRAEEALRESEDKFKYVFDHSVLAKSITLPSGQMSVNEAFCDLLGYTQEELQNKRWQDITHPDDIDLSQGALDPLLSGAKESSRFIKRYIHKNGAVVWADVSTSLRLDKEGKPLYFMTAILDITERKRSEDALRLLSERQQALLSAIPDIIMEVDTDKTYRWANQAGIAFFGDDVIGREAAFYFEGEQDTYNIVRPVFSGEENVIYVESWQRRQDGQKRLLAWWCRTLKDQQGEVVGALSSARDITESKRVEVALKQNTERLKILHEIDQAILLAETPQAIAEAVLEHLRELVPCWRASVAIFDFEHNQVEVLASHVLGRTQVGTGSKMTVQEYGIDEEILHGEIALINDLVSRPHLSIMRQMLVTEGVHSIINVPLLAQGQPIGSLNLEATEPAAFLDDHIEIAREVADQLAIAIQHARLSERDQRHAEELEQRVAERTAELRAANEQLQALSHVKDEFISNISHELRTPIASVKIHLHLLTKRPEERQKYVEASKREITRLEHLIEGLLTLSRLDQKRVSVDPTPIDLNHLIDEYVTDREHLAENKNVSLRFEPLEEIPGIEGDRHLIGEVLSILLTNAINYTPADGQVAISTQTQETGGRSWVGFSVSDSGCGILPEELPRLFERFYRGKAARETQVPGTGLGLSIAREIINLHAGHIEVDSDGIPGHGAKFSIWLPAVVSS